MGKSVDRSVSPPEAEIRNRVGRSSSPFSLSDHCLYTTYHGDMYRSPFYACYQINDGADLMGYLKY